MLLKLVRERFLRGFDGNSGQRPLMSAVEPDSAVEGSEIFESVFYHLDYVPDQIGSNLNVSPLKLSGKSICSGLSKQNSGVGPRTICRPHSPTAR